MIFFYLAIGLMYLMTLSLFAGGLLAVFLLISAAFNPPNPDVDDGDGWHGDVDPLYPIGPVCPEEKEDYPVCV